MRDKKRVSQRRRAIARNIAVVAVLVAGGPYAFRALKDFVISDPFVGLFKATKSDLKETIGIRMDGVDLRDYQGGKLISSATARRVDVQKDRSSATLYDVTDGMYSGDKGPFRYAATQAIWNFQIKQVEVNKGVSVQNKDMDLKAGGLVFDDRTHLLRIGGDVRGRLYKGTVDAAMVSYNMKTGATEAGPFEWQGTVALSPQDDAQATPKRWTIKGAHWKSLPTDANVIVYEKATASDEDLMIVAPHVEQNKKTDVLSASGGIEYYSGKADIKADKCVVYRKEKRTVLTGHVFMYVKPKAQENDPPKVEKLPDFTPVTPTQVVVSQDGKPVNKDEEKTKEDELRSSKNLREFPMVIVSEQTEYWYGKGNRHAVITGNPQGRQRLKDDEWRHVWSHIAFYDGEKETLKLVSTEGLKDALMKNSVGDQMSAKDILVSTKEDDDSIEGDDADGWIYSADEDSQKDNKQKTATPPPGKKAGGTGV